MPITPDPIQLDPWQYVIAIDLAGIRLDSVEPSTDVRPGETVTASGSGFGATQGAGKVELGTTADHATATLTSQTVLTWSDQTITFAFNPSEIDATGQLDFHVFVTNNAASTSNSKPIAKHAVACFTGTYDYISEDAGASRLDKITNPSLSAGNQFDQVGNTPEPWRASTAYALFDQVMNDTGKAYSCDTAGTSASSGGPTGTGNDIVDGTARWDFIGNVLAADKYLFWKKRVFWDFVTIAGAPALWSTSTAFSVGDERRTEPTGGVKRIYVCVEAGTSDSVGPGPTGTGRGIVDNTVKWDFKVAVPNTKIFGRLITTGTSIITEAYDFLKIPIYDSDGGMFLLEENYRNITVTDDSGNTFPLARIVRWFDGGPGPTLEVFYARVETTAANAEGSDDWTLATHDDFTDGETITLKDCRNLFDWANVTESGGTVHSQSSEPLCAGGTQALDPNGELITFTSISAPPTGTLEVMFTNARSGLQIVPDANLQDSVTCFALTVDGLAVVNFDSSGQDSYAIEGVSDGTYDDWRDAANLNNSHIWERLEIDLQS